MDRNVFDFKSNTLKEKWLRTNKQTKKPWRPFC